MIILKKLNAMRKQEYKLLTNPPDPTSHQSIVEWLAATGWVEGFIRKKISPLDRHLIEDYTQECWVQIISNKNLVEVYKRGKGKFVNYIKSIITNNIYSSSSQVFKKIKQFNHNHFLLDNSQLSYVSDYGQLEVETKFPVIERDSGVENRVVLEYTKEIISTKPNEDRFDQIETD